MKYAFLPVLFMLIVIILPGCAWTNTQWLIKEDGSPTVELLDPTKNPSNVNSPRQRIALLETKALKGLDSQLDLLASTIEEAKKIGAQAIWCPDLKGDQFKTLMTLPSIPTSAEIEKDGKLAEQIKDLIVKIISLPLTLVLDIRTNVLSDKTMLCVAYREKTQH